MSFKDLDRDVLLQEIHQIRKTLDEASGRGFGNYSSSSDGGETSDDDNGESYWSFTQENEFERNGNKFSNPYAARNNESVSPEDSQFLDNKLMLHASLGITDPSNHDPAKIISEASKILTKKCVETSDKGYIRNTPTPRSGSPVSHSSLALSSPLCRSGIVTPTEHNEGPAKQKQRRKNFDKINYLKLEDAGGTSIDVSIPMTMQSKTEKEKEKINMSNLYVERIFRNYKDRKNKSMQQMAFQGLKNDNKNFECSASLRSLENLLQVNKRYQETLQDELKKIQLALSRNRNAQSEILCNNEEDRSSHTFLSLSRACLGKFVKPYFRDLDGYGPPENQDTKDKNALLKVNPFTKAAKPWRASENAALKEGVYNNNLELRLTPLLAKVKALDIEYKERKKRGESDIDKSKKSRLLKEIQEIKNVPQIELLRDATDIDFFKIAKNYLASREEFDCHLQWINVVHPNINQNKFSKEEDGVIIKLAKKYENHNWESIARELDTHRTPVQCLQRFQRTLNKDMLKNSWDKETDDMLIKAVKRYGHDWVSVAGYLGDRTSNQCLFRWDKTLNPKIKRGKWDEDEDQLLRIAVEKYGMKNWKMVKLGVPGRTDAQCRDRYVSSVDPNINYGPFTETEDMKIIELVEKFGVGKWSRIAQEFEGRRDNHIWRRYKQIQSEPYHKYRRDVLWKKNSVLNYFLHRQAERREYELDELDVSYTPNLTRVEAQKVEKLQDELVEKGLSQEEITKHLSRLHFEGYFNTPSGHQTIHNNTKLRNPLKVTVNLAEYDTDGSDTPLEKDRTRRKRKGIRTDSTEISEESEGDLDQAKKTKKDFSKILTNVKKKTLNRKTEKLIKDIKETIASINDPEKDLPLISNEKVKLQPKKHHKNPTCVQIAQPNQIKKMKQIKNLKPKKEDMFGDRLKKRCQDVISSYKNNKCLFEEGMQKLTSLSQGATEQDNDEEASQTINEYIDVLMERHQRNENIKKLILDQQDDDLQVVLHTKYLKPGKRFKSSSTITMNKEIVFESKKRKRFKPRKYIEEYNGSLVVSDNQEDIQDTVVDQMDDQEQNTPEIPHDNENDNDNISVDNLNENVEEGEEIEVNPMGKQLQTFTLLLQALHIDTASVIRTLPQSSEIADGEISNNSTETNEPFPNCFPISPNVSTLQAFRTLLLHRRSLFNIYNRQYPPTGHTVPATRDLTYRNTRSYDALRKRFRSTFFWPSFLATFLPKYTDNEAPK